RLEIGAVDQAQFVKVVVIPARIGRAGNVPRGSIVGQHHAVFLKRSQDHLVRRREARDVETGAQAEARAHRRVLRAGQAGRIVASRPYEGSLRLRYREADGVANFSGGDLVVTQQPGKNREARGIRGGPSGGTQGVREQVED